jgi:ribosomal protein S18 acetylase RimI-like enzyme
MASSVDPRAPLDADRLLGSGRFVSVERDGSRTSPMRSPGTRRSTSAGPTRGVASHRTTPAVYRIPTNRSFHRYVKERDDERVVSWNPDRIWDAFDAWRWIPPTAKRETTEEYELAVTPGSYALTYVYGFRVDDARRADERLDAVKKRIQDLGGTGARFQLTPRSRPTDLAERLARHGYQAREQAEVLAWLLRDDRGGSRQPDFPAPTGITVREIRTDPEYEKFGELGTVIFGDPAPPAESQSGFLSEFHRVVREVGHSDRWLAFDGATAVGRAGMELVGPVARLWGTGVAPEYRRRGIYGALVRARCESAARRGGELALVSARVGTSGPILKRHGFERLGSVQIFEARW